MAVDPSAPKSRGDNRSAVLCPQAVSRSDEPGRPVDNKSAVQQSAAVHPVQSDGRGGNQEESTQRLVVVHPGQWDARDSLGKAKFPEEVLRARSDEPEKPVDSK